MWSYFVILCFFCVQENEEEEAEDAVFVNYNDVMQEINIDEEGNGNSTDLDC
jgi:hypothetical protein